MVKRFTETTKWKDAWFGDLTSKYKLFWCYILDDCDNCGIWEVNFKVAQFLIGESLEFPEVKRIFKDRIVELNDGKYWFIPKFIKYQYGLSLSKNNKAVKNVIDKLETKKLLQYLPEIAIIDGASKEHQSPLQGAKEKEKEKEELKVLYKDQEIIEDWFIRYKKVTAGLGEIEYFQNLIDQYDTKTVKNAFMFCFVEKAWKSNDMVKKKLENPKLGLEDSFSTTDGIKKSDWKDFSGKATQMMSPDARANWYSEWYLDKEKEMWFKR